MQCLSDMITLSFVLFLFCCWQECAEIQGGGVMREIGCDMYGDSTSLMVGILVAPPI